MKEVILLLDDEEHIRIDLGGALQKSGYCVHRASSIEEAKKIILSEEIELAIVDLKLDYKSEFGGVEVVNFIKRLRPKAKALVLSAYPLEDDIKCQFEVEIDGYVAKGGHQNYIRSVLTKLNQLETTRETKRCFVIMPFSGSKTCTEKEWNEIFTMLIKPAVEESGFNIVCTRSEALHGNIIEDILDQLNRADLVVADMTDRNPNVFYELGVRHALGGATILIAQNLEDVPFDLRPYATQRYDWKIKEDKDKFKNRIKEIISYLEGSPSKLHSPIRKYLNL